MEVKILRHQNSVTVNLMTSRRTLQVNQVQVLVPERLARKPSRVTGHKEKAGNFFLQQDGQHVGEAIQKTVVATDQHGSWRKRCVLLESGQQFARGDYVVVRFQNAPAGAGPRPKSNFRQHRIDRSISFWKNPMVGHYSKTPAGKTPEQSRLR